MKVVLVIGMWFAFFACFIAGGILRDYDFAAYFGVNGLILMKFAEWRGVNFYIRERDDSDRSG